MLFLGVVIFQKVGPKVSLYQFNKKGNKRAMDNYRSITLLSVFGKLFTRVLNNRLTFWAESYGILIEEQGGFREKRSTIDNIFVLHSLINLVTEKGGKVYTAFVDFRKAFDYVNRDCLWSKLITSGIRGNILNIIRSMYNEVKSKVKYRGNTLISANREGLQDSLDCLYDYCIKWGLFLNVDKTKVVVFRKGGVLSYNDFWFYGDTKLEIVDIINYLGLHLSYTGKFSCKEISLIGVYVLFML